MTESQASDYGGQLVPHMTHVITKPVIHLANVNQQALQEMANAALSVTLELSATQQRRPASFHLPIELDHRGEWFYDRSFLRTTVHRNLHRLAFSHGIRILVFALYGHFNQSRQAH